MPEIRNGGPSQWGFTTIGLALLLLVAAASWASADSLEQQFYSPPDSAKPRVWWHWMDGNVSREGIAADLQWMSRVGIGGVHLVDVGLGTPQWIDDQKPFMSPGWKKAFSYSVDFAADEGLEFGVFSSPGWSITGGPWVKPEQAMKKLVWSKAHVEGGTMFKGALPNLPIATGPFQNVVKTFSGKKVAGGVPQPLLEYHRDTIVIAYREPSAEPVMPAPKVHANFALGDVKTLIDDDSESGLTLPVNKGKKPLWIQMDYGEPLAVRSVTVSASPAGSAVNLAISEDGEKFRHHKTFFLGAIGQSTVDMEPVTARYYRFSFPVRPPAFGFFPPTAAPGASRAEADALLGVGQATRPRVVVRSLILRQTARVNHFEKKAGFELPHNYYAIDTPSVPEHLSVPTRDVIDLTELVQEDGYLQWQAPPGNWVVLRMGYSLTGNMNQAASAAGTGLEVDKLNRVYVQQYMDSYLQTYEDILGPTLMGKRGLNAFMTDSFEVGLQNWTDDILDQFERLRGYDPRPWLPTLTGIVIESAGKSDRFLWDFRKTIADLTRDSHYKVIAETAQAKGLTVYGEALESQRWFLGDDMDFRQYADIPTAAMWMFAPDAGPQPGFVADILGAASVAHVYGKNLVAAESLTSALAPWASAPRDLKPVIDLEFALGINRPIIHSSVHQPRDDRKPGLSLSIFGQYLNRHDTWADSAKAWTDYLARSAYLLQQGRYQADIAYFYGEETPLSVIFSAALPTEIPPGYGYDFVNANAILTQMSVEDGYFVTPSGMRYRLLFLGGTSKRMTLPVLKKLQKMVSAGGLVVGAKPVSSPSLADDEAEFHRIATEIWGAEGEPGEIARAFGDGQVFIGTDVGLALARLQLQKDFEYSPADPHTQLVFNHRVLPQGHVYFISNQSDRPESVEASFRVSGKQAELWHAHDGSIEPVSYRMESDRTFVPLNLAPFESVFVVFRDNTQQRSQQIVQAEAVAVAKLDSDWQLSFTPHGGASTHLENLSPGSWSEHQNEALNYFSGTATYQREFDVPASWIDSEDSFVLELGEVRELAEVVVNTQTLGTLWKPPYRIDITHALRTGRNVLTIMVTNLWVNQLIGDQRPGHKGFSRTSIPTYLPDARLRPSGLIGPVSIERISLPSQ